MPNFQNTKSYHDLVDTIKALCSKSFSVSDLARVNLFINQGIRTLYDRYPFWSRYLSVAEPRRVSSGYIQRVSDSYIVSNSPNKKSIGVYERDSSLSDTWVLRSEKSSDPFFMLVQEPSGVWSIYKDENDGSSPPVGLYSNNGTSLEPDDSTWYDFDDLSEQVDVLCYKSRDVEQFIHVLDGSSINSDAMGSSVNFFVDTRGARIIGPASQKKYLSLTYKSPLPEKFGDNEGNESRIPSEFFEYASLYAARMFNMSKQVGTDPNVRNITLAELEASAANQLMIQERNNPDFIQRITKVH